MPDTTEPGFRIDESETEAPLGRAERFNLLDLAGVCSAADQDGSAPAEPRPLRQLLPAVAGLLQGQMGAAQEPSEGNDRLQRRQERRERLGNFLRGLKDLFGDLRVGPGSLEYRTDFARLLDAVPGLVKDQRLEEARRFLAGMRCLSVKGETVALEMEKPRSFSLDSPEARKFQIKELKLGDGDGRVSADVVLDRDDPRKAAIKNIKGVTIVRNGGAEVKIHEISFDASGQKPRATATIDNPATRPAFVSEQYWPKTVTIPIPLEDENGQAKTGAAFVVNALKIYAGIRAGLDHGDFSKLADAIPVPGLAEKLKLLGLMRLKEKGAPRPESR